MFFGGESAHVGSHLREEHRAGQFPDAIDGSQVHGRLNSKSRSY
jgi:hypothetical protein